MERIAFIGTGVMGQSMAAHLLSAGHSLTVYNRTKEKASDLLSRGARWADSAGEAASDADIVVTIVGYPKDVESTYLSPGGVIDRAREGAILIDMTTSSPTLAVHIAKAAALKGISALDAPVSGGDLGARNANLSIMVGGEKAAFDSVLPILKLMGKNVVLQGKAGAGQHCKMCNQIAIASNMMGVVEALNYGVTAGLDPRTMLKSIESGAAGSWSLSNLVPRMIDGNYEPGFYVKHFIKDMGIAIDSAKELNLNLPGLELALRLYKKLAELPAEKLSSLAILQSNDGSELGTQALNLLYLAGIP